MREVALLEMPAKYNKMTTVFADHLQVLMEAGGDPVESAVCALALVLRSQTPETVEHLTGKDVQEFVIRCMKFAIHFEAKIASTSEETAADAALAPKPISKKELN